MAFKFALKLCKIVANRPCDYRPRLVSIGFSHFCEKSRWALDLSPLTYYEEIHCPGMHLSSTIMELADTPRIAPWHDVHFDEIMSKQFDRKKDKRSVPKMILPDIFALEKNVAKCTSVVASGSSGIFKYLATQYPSEMGHLYPPADNLGDNVLDFESYLDSTLAPAATRWAFGNFLLYGAKFTSSDTTDSQPVPKDHNKESAMLFIRKATQLSALPWMEKLIVGTFGTYVLPLMAQSNNITAENREEALTDIRRIFTEVDVMLSQAVANQSDADRRAGKQVFLFNTDRPSAADITFAALTMPVLVPPQTKYLFALAEELEAMDPVKAPGCARLAAVRKELLAAHPSARYALHLYSHYRFPDDCKRQQEHRRHTGNKDAVAVHYVMPRADYNLPEAV